MTKPSATARYWLRCCRAESRLLALGAVLLLVVPTVRTSELSEVETATQRVEIAATETRTVNLKRQTLHGRQERVVFTASHPFLLGHAQQVSPALASGHRLANGLMAPMTC